MLEGWHVLRAETRAPTVPSELILLIWTVLWSALVRRYHVATTVSQIRQSSSCRARPTGRFVVEHAGVGVRVVARRQMHLVDGAVAPDHLGGLEGQHVSILLAV